MNIVYPSPKNVYRRYCSFVKRVSPSQILSIHQRGRRDFGSDPSRQMHNARYGYITAEATATRNFCFQKRIRSISHTEVPVSTHDLELRLSSILLDTIPCSSLNSRLPIGKTVFLLQFKVTLWRHFDRAPSGEIVNHQGLFERC